VGQEVNNGLVIAISGENVTGPRVLLVNMSKTFPLSLYPALNVTLDGQPVAEASSALQVLNPVSSNPPYYVVVATSDSVQLLISIPHFSLHLITVAGVIVHTLEASLELDAPLLLGSIFVITLAFAAAYAAEGGTAADLAALAQNAGFHKALGDVVARIGRDLPAAERVRRFTIAGEPFSLANMQLTPTLKIRRHAIREAYQAAFEMLYDGTGLAA